MRVMFIFALLLMVSNCYANTYICVDKNTDEVRGVTDISEDHIASWADSYKLIEADESYRGKQPYEIKMELGVPRHATKFEIDLYKAQKEAAQVAAKKADAMNTLGITTKDIEKIKKLPEGAIE